MRRRSSTGRYTLRATSALVGFWAGTVVLAACVLVPLVRGDWAVFGFALAPSLFLCWLLWLILYRPAVHYDSSSATVVNIGRIHVIPWARVTAVVQKVNLVFELRSGRTISAWGVPYPRRPGNLERLIDRRTRRPYDLDVNARTLDEMRRSAAPSATQVDSRWDVVPLMMGAVLLAAAVVTIVVFGIDG